jgi:hypothetical protein
MMSGSQKRRHRIDKMPGACRGLRSWHAWREHTRTRETHTAPRRRGRERQVCAARKGNMMQARRTATDMQTSLRGIANKTGQESAIWRLVSAAEREKPAWLFPSTASVGRTGSGQGYVRGIRAGPGRQPGRPREAAEREPVSRQAGAPELHSEGQRQTAALRNSGAGRQAAAVSRFQRSNVCLRGQPGLTPPLIPPARVFKEYSIQS